MKVLIVDSSPEICRAYRRGISSWGKGKGVEIELVVTQSLFQAREEIEGASFDLIISGNAFGGIRAAGEEFLLARQGLNDRAKLVMATGGGTPSQQFLKAFAGEVLLKPFDRVVFLGVLEDALARAQAAAKGKV